MNPSKLGLSYREKKELRPDGSSLGAGVAISLPWADGGRRSPGAERDCGADEQGIPDFSRIASGFPSEKGESERFTQ